MTTPPPRAEPRRSAPRAPPPVPPAPGHGRPGPRRPGPGEEGAEDRDRGRRRLRQDLAAHGVQPGLLPRALRPIRVREVHGQRHGGQQGGDPEPLRHGRAGRLRPAAAPVLPEHPPGAHLLRRHEPHQLRQRPHQVVPRGHALLPGDPHGAHWLQDGPEEGQGAAAEAAVGPAGAHHLHAGPEHLPADAGGPLPGMFRQVPGERGGRLPGGGQGGPQRPEEGAAAETAPALPAALSPSPGPGPSGRD